MISVLKSVLDILRFLASALDCFIFGRFCENHTGAGTVLTIPFYMAAVCVGFLFYMNIAKGYGSSFGDTVLCLEGAACCISLALHYKHYFRMPTVKLKIFYFLYLTVWTFGMALLFLWLFVYVAIGLFLVVFIWLITQNAPPASCSVPKNDGVIELSDGSKVKQSMSNPKVYNDIYSDKKFVRNGNDFLEM